ncbi:hypothetical protein [Desulfovibrio sp. TomC]|uniref:hypothetical protein n=1 Tax=Desulfovibrio sp. TomC TaxID=1562888 RepID=UPI000573B9C4|nr:hypothetical protein [Desulfovibrio sp. TomC]KHK00232.1 hypothetical protein NY78_4347 [Desulfovibrio sp. TomC]
MDQKHIDEFELKDELSNAFRPIEELFKIMDACSTDIYGELIRSHAEVGIVLCKNYRKNLENLLTKKIGN